MAFGDGKLFAVGGGFAGYPHKSVEYLELKDMEAGSLKNKRRRLDTAAAAAADEGVSVDGFAGSSPGWKKLFDIWTVRVDLDVAVVDGKLFAVGGRTNFDLDDEEGEKDSCLKSGQYLRIDV